MPDIKSENRESLLKSSDGSSSAGLMRNAPNVAAQPDTSRRIPEFSDLILGCRHHLLLVAVLGVIVSLAMGASAWWLTDALFEAESLVHVRQYQDVVYSAQTSRADDVAFVRGQEQVVLSPTILASALASEQLRAYARYIPDRDSVEWLKNKLKVEIEVGSEVLSVSASHTRPEVAQALCNAVTSSYLAEITNRLDTDRLRRQQELERVARQADIKLDALWEELNTVASQVGSDNSHSLTIRDEIQMQAYRDYAQQLRAAQRRGNELDRLLASEMAHADESQPGEQAVELMLQNQPDVITARNRVLQTNAQVEQMREVAANGDSPRLKRLFADLEQFEADLKRLEDERRPLLLSQYAEQDKIAKEKNLAQLQKQIDVNDAEREFLQSRLAEMDTVSAEKGEQSGVQLEMARHAVERQTKLADGLWRSLEELNIESHSRPRVTLIQLANLPDHSNHTKQLKSSVAFGGLGWILVLVGMGFFEWYGCRVRSSADLSSHSSRPVYGQINAAGTLGKGQATASGVQQAAAKLVLLSNGGDKIPSLMVSSATAEEPRHLVSVDLARAFAGFKRRTLLIDCDAIGTQLRSFLSADSVLGILDIPPTHADPSRFVVATSETGLDVLVLGTGDQASPWLEPRTLGRVLESVRGKYDAIVVNGPPMLSSAEGLLLASQTDQVMLAVFPGQSRWNGIAASEKTAAESGIAVAGSILHSARKSERIQVIPHQDLSTAAMGASAASRSPVAEEESELHHGITAIQEEIQQAASSPKEQRSKSHSATEVS